jgi:hypothetical protein
MHQGRKNRSSNRHERMSSQQSWRWPSSLSPRMAINALITVCCSLLLVIHFLWRPVGLPAGLPGRTGTLLWPPRGFVALRDGSLSKCSDDVCFPFSWSNLCFGISFSASHGLHGLHGLLSCGSKMILDFGFRV